MGSWDMQTALLKRLNEREILKYCKEIWKAADRDRFLAVYKHRAKPDAPLPYAVMSVPADTQTGHHSAPSDKTGLVLAQTRTAIVVFTCFSTSEQGEAVAIELANRIGTALTEGKELVFTDDVRFIKVIRDSDLYVKDDDDNHVWQVRLDIEYEAMIEPFNE